MAPMQREDIAAFYRTHLHNLIIHAYTYTNDWDLAKDVVQDAFKKTLEPQKTGEFLSSQNPVGWMKNMVKNTARNAVKARSRELERLTPYDDLHDEPTTVDHYPSEEEAQTLGRCLGRLSKEELALLRRVALDKVSYLEAARELGISVWACYKRVKKSREKLRGILEEEK